MIYGNSLISIVPYIAWVLRLTENLDWKYVDVFLLFFIGFILFEKYLFIFCIIFELYRITDIAYGTSKTKFWENLEGQIQAFDFLFLFLNASSIGYWLL